MSILAQNEPKPSLTPNLILARFEPKSLAQSLRNHWHKTNRFNQLNGFWESDGVGDLQVLIRKKINEDNHLSFKLLSELSQDEVYSFFKFIFDGPVLLEIEPKWEITGEQFPDILFQMIKAHKDLSKITR
jgi:hypothetical protein